MYGSVLTQIGGILDSAERRIAELLALVAEKDERITALEQLLEDNPATAPAEPMTSGSTEPEQPITLGSRKRA